MAVKFYKVIRVQLTRFRQEKYDGSEILVFTHIRLLENALTLALRQLSDQTVCKPAMVYEHALFFSMYTYFVILALYS